MKTFVVAVAAALVSAAASVGSFGAPGTAENDHEATVEFAVSADQASSVIPFIELAAREDGIQRIRAYKNDIFIPLEQSTLSFVKANGKLTMHVAVETEYRFAKGERQQVLAGLTAKGNALYARALILKAQAN